MAGKTIKTTVELDGEAKYKESLNSINQALRVSSSEMGAVTSAYDKNNASVDDLTKKGDVLAKQIEQQTQKQQILNAAITDARAAYEAAVKKAAEMSAEYGENSKQAQDAAKAVADAEKAVNGYEIQANNATKVLNNMKRQQDENNKAIDEMNNKNTNSLASKFEKLSENAKKFGSVAAAAAKAAAGAIAAVGTAATAAVKGVIDMANQTAQLGDKIDKSSQKLGVSAEFYQEWDAVLQHSGTSMDAMSATFKKLATASQGATKKQQEAFEQLGLSMEQVQGMSAEELFTAVVGKLQEMEDSTERTALATTLLGKGAQELGPLLNTSAEDTQKMIDEVNRLGGVMSNEAVKASATYQDTLQDLQTAISGVKNTLAAEVMPIITMVMMGLTALITGDNGGLQMISEGINSFVEMLSGALPNILTMVSTLFTDLLATATDNLPSLIETVTGALLNIIETIMKMLPDILNAGVQILLTLAEGIASSLPELIPVIIDVILTVVDNLIDNIPMLIDAALAIIVGLADGLIGALPQLVERIPEIITAIINALISSIPLLIDAAVQLFVAMTEALPVALPAIVGMIPQISSAIVDALLGYDWIGLGIELINCIAAGISEGAKNIGSMIKGAADNMWNGIKGALGLGNDSKSAANTGAELAQVVTKGFIGTMQENTAEVAAVMPYAKAASESEKYTEEITEQEEKAAAAYTSTAKTAENSTKKQTKATKTKTENILSEAKKTYDKVLGLYKDGKISSEEYNKQYAAILKKYSSEQVNITEYAQEKMTDVAEKEAEKRVSTLKKSIEKEISEYQKEFDSIQKQMESFSGKLTKAYKDVYTFTTDEKTGKISAKTTDVMIKSKKELEKYLADIEALQKRGVSNTMLQQLTGMSKDEGAAVAEYWMSLSDQQLKNLQNNWTAYNNVSAKISQAIYADEAKSAAEGMLNAIGETLSANESNLQDSGVMILQGLKQGILNDKGIKEIKSLCDGIVSAMTGYFETNAVDVSIGAKILNGNIVSTSGGNNNSGGGTGTTYNFTQNNYSPKALSRDEINRDTQRQLQLAGMK